MVRGELLKRLLSSYGRDDEFRAVAEQIIAEEEKKNNRILARSLRKSLNGSHTTPAPAPSLVSLQVRPVNDSEFLEYVAPSKTARDVVVSGENTRVFVSLLREFRSREAILRYGIPARSKILLAGPPGSGKTVSAEAFSFEAKLPLYIVKIDRLVSSYLGETASNLRKIFEFAQSQPCVLFLDEFDAIARSRADSEEHSEIRRVVNSLLVFIDRMRPSGYLFAATNMEQSLDDAVWRRFDEVLWFGKPTDRMVRKFLRLKFKNVPVSFDTDVKATHLMGFSFAEVERVCFQAIRSMLVDRRRSLSEQDFDVAVQNERRRVRQRK